MLRALGVSVIGQQNIGLVFRGPMCVLLLLCAFLLLAFYVYLEVTALVLYCEEGWQGRPISVWRLWRRAFPGRWRSSIRGTCRWCWRRCR